MDGGVQGSLPHAHGQNRRGLEPGLRQAAAWCRAPRRRRAAPACGLSPCAPRGSATALAALASQKATNCALPANPRVETLIPATSAGDCTWGRRRRGLAPPDCVRGRGSGDTDACRGTNTRGHGQGSGSTPRAGTRPCRLRPELRPRDRATTSVCGPSHGRGPAPPWPRAAEAPLSARLSFCETSGESPPTSRRPHPAGSQGPPQVSWSRGRAALRPLLPRGGSWSGSVTPGVRRQRGG